MFASWSAWHIAAGPQVVQAVLLEFDDAVIGSEDEVITVTYGAAPTRVA